MEWFKTTILPLLRILSGLASLLGAFFVIISDDIIPVRALSFWGVALLSCLVLFYFEIRGIVCEEKETDYNLDSVFITFETIGATKSKYQIFKIIQSKQQVLSNYTQQYNWSGSFMPVLSSNIEEVIGGNEQFIKDKYHDVKLRFKRPITYNESTTVHFCAIVDDSDNVASPHVQFKVEKPIRFLRFRIVLRNKQNSYSKTAKLLTKPIDSNFYVKFKEEKSISFDAKSKTYFHQIINPKVGNIYRVEWEKDTFYVPQNGFAQNNPEKPTEK